MLSSLGLIVFLLAYLVYFGAIARPERSIYAFLLVWVLVPKSFRMFYLTGNDLPDGLTIFNIVEGAAALAIALAMIVHHSRLGMPPALRRVRQIALLLCVSGAIGLFVSYGILSMLMRLELDGMWGFLQSAATAQERILPVAAMFYAVVLIFGASLFVRTERQMEIVLAIFFFSGLELVAETIVFFELHLVPGLSQWAVNDSGRFQSLVFTSYDRVDEFCIFAFCSGLYFARTRQRLRYYLGSALITLPLLATFARSALLGAALAVVVFWWLTAKGTRDRFFYAASALVLLLVALSMGLEQPILELFATHIGGEVRPDYFSTESLEVRVGYWARALDLVRFTAPFGAGPGMARYALQYNFHQGYYGLSDLGLAAYDGLALGTRETVVHNEPLQFVVEHGVLGIVALLIFVTLLVSNFTQWRRRRMQVVSPRRDVALGALFAMFVGEAFNTQFEPTMVPYSIHLLLAYLTSLCLCLDHETLRRHRVQRTAPVARKVELREVPTRAAL